MPEAYYSAVAATERSALTSRRIPGARTQTARASIDLAAFESLYESHGARMKSLALNVLGNRSDAEDAVQETFLRAYKNRHSFRSDAALWTWVYRILLNACHDIGRSRAARRDNQMVDADVAVDLPTPAGDSPMRLTLERAVDGLAPIYRDVFLLCEVEVFESCLGGPQRLGELAPEQARVGDGVPSGQQERRQTRLLGDRADRLGSIQCWGELPTEESHAPQPPQRAVEAVGSIQLNREVAKKLGIMFPAALLAKETK